ncbi:DUF551 domain-containing protein [Pectobacterium polaris]|uniref:DUF551 domain-containing protein n=1 Tax=Pectobacterium polaris TaxID=2042057 RepID=UPI0013FD5F69|nr:DUF551 domain-containing protein [Pectobacterium polaris]
MLTNISLELDGVDEDCVRDRTGRSDEYCEGFVNGMIEAACQIRDNNPVLQTVPHSWIGVSENMPDDGDTVLVCQEGGIVFCAEVENGEFYPDEFPNVPKEGREITHWQHLPKAPTKS